VVVGDVGDIVELSSWHPSSVILIEPDIKEMSERFCVFFRVFVVNVDNFSFS